MLGTNLLALGVGKRLEKAFLLGGSREVGVWFLVGIIPYVVIGIVIAIVLFFRRR